MTSLPAVVRFAEHRQRHGHGFLAHLADETPEGRSTVVLAKERYQLRGRDLSSHGTNFIPFSAQTRMSGVDIDGREIRKGALEAISRLSNGRGNIIPEVL
jgi:K+-transporting ATPase ATPase B chain